MKNENIALSNNNTWTKVPYHPLMNVLGCKWVYKVKLRSYGSVGSYKSRLAAKGYHQLDGIDYTENFSLLVKFTTIRVILTIALFNGWIMRQLDVSNAFWHGALHETVYMEQPKGFF